MSISIIHLPTDLRYFNQANQQVALRPFMIYLGQAISNLKESIFYRDLSEQQYRRWLRQQINIKSDVYTSLSSIKYIALADKDITFVCSCSANYENDCRAVIIKRAVLYLLAAEDLAFGSSSD